MRPETQESALGELSLQDFTVQERRRRILEMLHDSGRVRVAELSRLFAVSDVSIRHDLAEMEGQDLLSRVHGGAVSSYDSYYNMSLAQRSSINRLEKEEIARQIAEMVHDNQSVMMNAGTTTLAVAHQLAQKHNITVVTNSVVLALEASKHANLHVILLGGEINFEYQFVYGNLTLTQLKDYYADTFILSADGIDAEGGITTYYDQEVEICREMMEHSKTVIAAMDYTKVGRMAFCKIATADHADVLVTNRTASTAAVGELQAKGVTVVTATETEST